MIFVVEWLFPASNLDGLNLKDRTPISYGSCYDAYKYDIETIAFSKPIYSSPIFYRDGYIVIRTREHKEFLSDKIEECNHDSIYQACKNVLDKYFSDKSNYLYHGEIEYGSLESFIEMTLKFIKGGKKKCCMSW